MDGDTLIAARSEYGALLCAHCAEVAHARGANFDDWYAVTADEVADEAEMLFESLLPNVADLYPDMPIEPWTIAQLSALPYCDVCGTALAKVSE